MSRTGTCMYMYTYMYYRVYIVHRSTGTCMHVCNYLYMYIHTVNVCVLVHYTLHTSKRQSKSVQLAFSGENWEPQVGFIPMTLDPVICH